MEWWRNDDLGLGAPSFRRVQGEIASVKLSLDCHLKWLSYSSTAFQAAVQKGYSAQNARDSASLISEGSSHNALVLLT